MAPLGDGAREQTTDGGGGMCRHLEGRRRDSPLLKIQLAEGTWRKVEFTCGK